MIDKEKLLSTFKARGFKPLFFDSKNEAISYLTSTINGKEVGIGGSLSVKELGLYEGLKDHNTVHWHWVTNDRETRLSELSSDVFILSANGVSETGALVNIDGSGNRLSASFFGPKKVIYIIGINKLEPTLDKAIWRARNIAATKNALRFGLNTPCVKAGGTKCFNCNSNDRICNGFLVITNPMNGQDVEVIFINEELGY